MGSLKRLITLCSGFHTDAGIFEMVLCEGASISQNSPI